MFAKSSKLTKYFTAHHVFSAIALCTGLTFVFATPLLWGGDETTHFARAYQISQGHVTAKKLPYPWGGFSFGGNIPTSVNDLIRLVNKDIETDLYVTSYGVKRIDNPADYKDVASAKLHSPEVIYFFPNTAAYSPLAYIPTSGGVLLAKLLNLPVGQTIILARILNLLSFTVVVYFALKILHRTGYEWLLLSVALIPMVIFQAATISADALAIALAMLVAAGVIKGILLQESLSKKELIIVSLGVVALPLIKLPYIFLSLMFLFIPGNKLFPRNARLIKSLVLLCTIVGFLMWAYATNGVTEAIRLIGTGDRWMNISMERQMQFIITHPLQFMVVIIRTILLKDNEYLSGLFGNLGFHFISTPAISMIFSIFAIFLSGLAIRQKNTSVKKVSPILILLLMGIGAVFVTLYLTFTDVGSPIVLGVQGRYFLPFVFPMLAIVAALIGSRNIVKTSPVNTKNLSLFITFLVTCSLLFTVIKFNYVMMG